MSISVLINGVEHKSDIDRDSFQNEDNLTAQVDTFEFATKMFGTGTFKPEVGDEVVVYDGAVKKFGGNIVEVEESVDSAAIIVYRATCKDYTHAMDGTKVKQIFTNALVETIVAAIIPAGFTGTHVSATGITIKYISFDYANVSDCLTELANLIGWDWYVDSNKDVHFFDRSVGEAAAFNLADTNGNYIFDSLKIKDDDSQIRNVVYVRGGEYAGDSRSDKVGTGDGAILSFNLPYKYDSLPTVTVNGVAQTVGIDGLNDPASYNCLWNYNGKTLVWATAPASGVILVTGKPMIRIICKAQIGASISANGIREFVVKDNTIITRETARQRAQAELEDYAFTLKTANFTTYTSGLRSGQKINIQSTIRTIDQDFIITRVTAKMRTIDTMEYDVECSTVREIGLIDYLKRIAIAEDKKLAPYTNENEVIDMAITLEDIDTYTGTDALLRAILNSPPTWVCGPYYPTSDADRTRMPYCDTGAVCT